MSKLPEWVLKESTLCHCADCWYAVHMHDALSIAWEALQREADVRQLPRDALRRIEALGEEK